MPLNEDWQFAKDNYTDKAVENKNGIEVVFKAVEGEPVLNALQVKRINVARQE